jgi:hypothetical protein
MSDGNGGGGGGGGGGCSCGCTDRSVSLRRRSISNDLSIKGSLTDFLSVRHGTSLSTTPHSCATVMAVGFISLGLMLIIFGPSPARAEHVTLWKKSARGASLVSVSKEGSHLGVQVVCPFVRLVAVIEGAHRDCSGEKSRARFSSKVPHKEWPASSSLSLSLYLAYAQRQTLTCERTHAV